MKPRKPRIRDLPPGEQAGRWWSSAYVKNAALSDEGLLMVLPKLYHDVETDQDRWNCGGYLKALLRSLKQRGLEERATALLVAERLKGNL